MNESSFDKVYPANLILFERLDLYHVQEVRFLTFRSVFGLHQPYLHKHTIDRLRRDLSNLWYSSQVSLHRLSARPDRAPFHLVVLGDENEGMISGLPGTFANPQPTARSHPAAAAYPPGRRSPYPAPP